VRCGRKCVRVRAPRTNPAKLYSPRKSGGLGFSELSREMRSDLWYGADARKSFASRCSPPAGGEPGALCGGGAVGSDARPTGLPLSLAASPLPSPSEAPAAERWRADILCERMGREQTGGEEGGQTIAMSITIPQTVWCVRFQLKALH
jgi:hypothetical protein